MPEYLHTETVAKQAMKEATREATGISGKARKAEQLQASRVVSNIYYTGLTPKKKDASRE